ncbi:putative phage tail protein, partial [Candidatus Erwinia dacicola]
MTRNDWRELLYLLPDGYARDGKRLNAELQAEGNMLASVERSAQDVLNGVTPFTAVALLSYWERVLGLSVSNGMTIQARRQQI